MGVLTVLNVKVHTFLGWIHMYLTNSSAAGQDMTQGQFFSGVQLI